MTGGERWFVGRVGHARDAIAHVTVVAEREVQGCRVVEAGQKAFPPHGEVELRGVAALALKRGEWLLFLTAPNDRRGSLACKVTQHRRLIRYDDLVGVGSPPEIRRLLVEDGLQPGDPAGDRVFRIADGAVVRLTMARGPDGRPRASGPHLRRLALQAHDPAGVLSVTIPDGAVIRFYDAGDTPQQLGVVDWSSDADYLARILGSLVDRDALAAAVAASHRRADEARGRPDGDRAAGAEGVDDVLWSGALADRFAAHQSQIDRYFVAMRSQPAVDALIEARAAAVAREARPALLAELRAEFEAVCAEERRAHEAVRVAFDAEGQRVRAELDAEVAQRRAALEHEVAERWAALDAEVAEARQERSARAKKAVEDLESEALADAQRRADARMAELDAALAERERKGLAEADAKLLAHKAALEDALGKLEECAAEIRLDVAQCTDERDALMAEVDGLGRSRADLESTVASLRETEAELTGRVDRLTRVAGAFEGAASGVRSGARLDVSPALPFSGTNAPGEPARSEELATLVGGHRLLTARGKVAMLRFVALLLAGEVPVLHGPGTDDFLEIAQNLVAAGRSTRLEADPTMIAFDDLWVRPGTLTATALREAATWVGGTGAGPPSTQLAVIAGADRSGVRFWYPALADYARRGRLPRRFLVCVTLDDPSSEEGRRFSAGRLFDAAGCVENNPAVAPLLLRGPRAVRRDLDPGEAPEDLSSAVHILGAVGGRLSAGEAVRLARLYVEAGRLMPEGDAETFIRETLAVWGAVPALTVVQTGGAARA